MKRFRYCSLLTKNHFLPLTDTIHYTFKKDFSLKGKFFLDFSLVFLYFYG